MSRLVVLIVILLVIIGFYPALLLIRSTHSTIAIDPAPKAVGLKTPLTLKISNPHGFRAATVWLDQNGTREKLFEASRPAHRWSWSGHDAPQDVAFTAAA